MKKAHKDSRTGERFISPSGKKYRLDYRHQRNTYYLGSFETVAEAIACREMVVGELDRLPAEQQTALMESL